MTREEYYIAPKQEIFDDIKAKAIQLWQTYDNEYGYVDEKVGRIEHIQNIRDNAGYIVAMFDVKNQIRLLHMVNDETRTWLEDVLEFSRSGQ